MSKKDYDVEYDIFCLMKNKTISTECTKEYMNDFVETCLQYQNSTILGKKLNSFDILNKLINSSNVVLLNEDLLYKLSFNKHVFNVIKKNVVLKENFKKIFDNLYSKMMKKDLDAMREFPLYFNNSLIFKDNIFDLPNDILNYGFSFYIIYCKDNNIKKSKESISDDLIGVKGIDLKNMLKFMIRVALIEQDKKIINKVFCIYDTILEKKDLNYLSDLDIYDLNKHFLNMGVSNLKNLHDLFTNHKDKIFDYNAYLSDNNKNIESIIFFNNFLAVDIELYSDLFIPFFDNKEFYDKLKNDLLSKKTNNMSESFFDSILEKKLLLNNKSSLLNTSKNIKKL